MRVERGSWGLVPAGGERGAGVGVGVGVGKGRREERKRWIPGTVRCARGTFSWIGIRAVLVRGVGMPGKHREGAKRREGAYHVDGACLPFVPC